MIGYLNDFRFMMYLTLAVLPLLLLIRAPRSNVPDEVHAVIE